MSLSGGWIYAKEPDYGEEILMDLFWNILGKLALLSGFIWSAIQIYKHINSLKIRAVAGMRSYVIPENIKGLSDLQHSYSLTEELRKQIPELTAEEAYSATRFHIEKFKALFEFNRSDAFVDLMIENRGDRQAIDMILELPDRGLYSVHQEGIKSEVMEFNNRIHLGALRSKNSMKVKIWARGGCDEILRKYYEEKIKITHPDGIIKIQFTREVRGWLAWVLTDTVNKIISFIFTCLVLFMVLLLALIIYAMTPAYRNKIQQPPSATSTSIIATDMNDSAKKS